MRPKFRLAKVHIWARDGPDCKVLGPGGEVLNWWTYDPEYMGPSCDGVAVWEVFPLSQDVGGPHYVYQHFGRTPQPDRGGGCPLIWKWDGNAEAPTLSPSFLYYGSRAPGAEGNPHDWPRIHLFLRAGKVENLSDSEADFEDRPSGAAP